MTIAGLNFGACFTATSSLGDSLNRPCASTSWTSTTTVECGVRASRNGVLEEVVTVGAIVGTRLGAFTLPTGAETRRASFTFDGATPDLYEKLHLPLASTFAPAAPVVSLFLPNVASAYSVGTTVTLQGLNFVPIDWTASVRLGDTLGLGACMTSSWTSATTISCTAGYGYGLWQRPAVTISEMVGTGDPYFFHSGCECTHTGCASLRCLSGASMVCTCKSNYTAAKCNLCSLDNLFDPEPYCKSGTCRVSSWTLWCASALARQALLARQASLGSHVEA